MMKYVSLISPKAAASRAVLAVAALAILSSILPPATAIADGGGGGGFCSGLDQSDCVALNTVSEQEGKHGAGVGEGVGVVAVGVGDGPHGQANSMETGGSSSGRQDVLEGLNADEFVKKSEQILLILMAFFIMLGMGASLTPRDFLSALRRPAGLFIGWVTQFGIMPFLAFAMMALTHKYIDYPPEVIAYIGIGAILMGSVPGGTTSNIFTFFSKGNLALSVIMTTNSTIWSLLMTPLALFIYAQTLFAGSVLALDGTSTENIIIPMANIIVTIALMLVPVFIAMGIRRYNANVGAVMELLGGALGIIFILYLIVTWVPRNWALLTSMPWPVYLVTVGLGLFGIMIAYNIAKAIRLHPRNARTVGLETGIQNGPLAIAIVLLTYSGYPNELSLVLIVPALYTLFIVFVSFFVTMYFRKANLAEEQKIPSLL